MEIGWEHRDTVESPSTSRRGPACNGWDFRKYSADIESARYLVNIGSKLSAHLQTILDRDRLMHPVANIQPSSSSIGPGQYSSNILNISRNQNHCKVPSNNISLKSYKYNPPIQGVPKTSQELRMLSPSLCIQRSQCNCPYCCSQLSEM